MNRLAREDQLALALPCKQRLPPSKTAFRVHSPMLLFPRRRPVLVEELGGGGFSSCDAVGARDWRIEYVRCMMKAWSQQEAGRAVIEQV